MTIKSVLAAGVALLGLSTVAHAQTALGVGQSQSVSGASATSVSGGGAGGAVTNNIRFSSPGQTRVENVTRNRSSGSLRTTSTAVAPNLVASAVGTCLGSAGVGIGATGWGFSAGSTIPDKDCNLRMYSEALLKTGQTAAGLAILCRNPEAYMAMTSVGLRCPIVPDGYQMVGHPPGTQPYMVEQVYVAPAPRHRKGRVVRDEPVYVPVTTQPSRIPVSSAPASERYAHEQAEAKAAVARIDAEYKLAKAACQARGDRVC